MRCSRLNRKKWLAEHGEIRVGYRDNYLPFCSTNTETGALTGALKDYLTHAENNLNSTHLHFKTIPYESTEAALAALNSGEVDCVFPLFLSTYDAAERGICLTGSAMETAINAIMRVSDGQDLSDESTLIFAVDADMINTDSFIMEHYPNTTCKMYPNLEACFQAVANGESDCVLVSNYRIPSEEDTLRKNDLFSVPTGETLPFSFAVRNSDSELYSVMNKTVLTTKSSETGAALASYLYQEQKVSFMRFLKDNLGVVLSVLIIVFAVILFLLWQKLQAERVANRQRHLLEEAAQVEKLHQTISSLLNNMPGIYLSKDAETGKYLACNQMFADYVHKKAPSELIGLTAADIFDADTAEHYVEDDKTVLSMDEPLIYYDSMQDMDGKPVSVKITKLKYTDANGRLCVLGIFQDVSDSLRISREKASSKESYEKARSSGMIFSHIAQALAQGYESLFYVDLNTEQFIEYRSDADGVGLSEVRRGWHFFEEGQDAAMVNIHPEDRDEVIRAMDRKTLVAALDQNPFYMYSHIAQTLARDYAEMFYVNTDSEEFIEYRSKEENSTLEEIRRGWHFFSDCKAELSESVYPDDREAFLTAMNRKRLMKALSQKKSFVMTYRRMISNRPVYVSMKISRMEMDEQYIIIGIMDVDEEIREAMAKNAVLSEALSSAEKANQAKAEFLADMSRKLCEPVRAIIEQETLALNHKELDAKNRESFEKIGQSARELDTVVSAILEMSRMESESSNHAMKI